MNMQERSQATQALWRKRIEACQRSGKSISAWCRENDVSFTQWQFWRKRLAPAAKSRQSGDTTDKSPVQRFIPLYVAPVVDPDPRSIRIDTSAGALHIVTGTDIHWLAGLLKALS
jgi:transposase-like protein